jgi:hypothetical protein
VEIDETAASFDETPGAGPSVSRNPMRGIEDMVEQNDNSFDGVINNLPEPKPVCQVSAAEVIEEEHKKKSVLKKLQEAAPAPDTPKPVSGCVLCGNLERF